MKLASCPRLINVFLLFSIFCQVEEAWGQAAQQAREIMETIQQARSNIDAKFNDGINREPRLNILIGKIPLRARDNISFEMLANNGLPSEEERQAILAYAKLFESVTKDYVLLYSMAGKIAGPSGEMFSGISDISKGSGDSDLNNLAELYGRRITFGSYNQRKQEIRRNHENSVKRLQIAIENRSTREIAELQRQQREDQRSRDRAYQQQRQREQENQERNRTTTCQRLGDFMFCSHN